MASPGAHPEVPGGAASSAHPPTASREHRHNQELKYLQDSMTRILHELDHSAHDRYQAVAKRLKDCENASASALSALSDDGLAYLAPARISNVRLQIISQYPALQNSISNYQAIYKEERQLAVVQADSQLKESAQKLSDIAFAVSTSILRTVEEVGTRVNTDFLDIDAKVVKYELDLSKRVLIFQDTMEKKLCERELVWKERRSAELLAKLVKDLRESFRPTPLVFQQAADRLARQCESYHEMRESVFASVCASDEEIFHSGSNEHSVESSLKSIDSVVENMLSQHEREIEQAILAYETASQKNAARVKSELVEIGFFGTAEEVERQLSGAALHVLAEQVDELRDRSTRLFRVLRHEESIVSSTCEEFGKFTSILMQTVLENRRRLRALDERRSEMIASLEEGMAGRCRACEEKLAAMEDGMGDVNREDELLALQKSAEEVLQDLAQVYRDRATFHIGLELLCTDTLRYHFAVIEGEAERLRAPFHSLFETSSDSNGENPPGNDTERPEKEENCSATGVHGDTASKPAAASQQLSGNALQPEDIGSPVATAAHESSSDSAPTTPASTPESGSEELRLCGVKVKGHAGLSFSNAASHMLNLLSSYMSEERSRVVAEWEERRTNAVRIAYERLERDLREHAPRQGSMEIRVVRRREGGVKEAKRRAELLSRNAARLYSTYQKRMSELARKLKTLEGDFESSALKLDRKVAAAVHPHVIDGAKRSAESLSTKVHADMIRIKEHAVEFSKQLEKDLREQEHTCRQGEGDSSGDPSGKQDPSSSALPAWIVQTMHTATCDAQRIDVEVEATMHAVNTRVEAITARILQQKVGISFLDQCVHADHVCRAAERELFAEVDDEVELVQRLLANARESVQCSYNTGAKYVVQDPCFQPFFQERAWLQRDTAANLEQSSAPQPDGKQADGHCIPPHATDTAAFVARETHGRQGARAQRLHTTLEGMHKTMSRRMVCLARYVGILRSISDDHLALRSESAAESDIAFSATEEREIMIPLRILEKNIEQSLESIAEKFEASLRDAAASFFTEDHNVDGALRDRIAGTLEEHVSQHIEPVVSDARARQASDLKRRRRQISATVLQSVELQEAIPFLILSSSIGCDWSELALFADACEREIHAWENAANEDWDRNSRKMKPSLANPNSAGRLKELINAEQNRSRVVREKMQKGRETIPVAFADRVANLLRTVQAAKLAAWRSIELRFLPQHLDESKYDTACTDQAREKSDPMKKPSEKVSKKPSPKEKSTPSEQKCEVALDEKCQSDWVADGETEIRTRDSSAHTHFAAFASTATTWILSNYRERIEKISALIDANQQRESLRDAAWRSMVASCTGEVSSRLGDR